MPEFMPYMDKIPEIYALNSLEISGPISGKIPLGVLRNLSFGSKKNFLN